MPDPQNLAEPLSAAEVWLAILLTGLGTFLLRFSMLALHGRIHLPERLLDALKFLPPAILTALVLPALYRSDPLGWAPRQPAHLLAGILAIGIAWRTRNMLATILGGMAAMWLLELWL
ncbi:MAG: AzlD domain-containing protein [bacterium]